jgi:hypothetical protein
VAALHRSGAVLFALAWLGGCALVYEGKYDWDEGWRVGRVITFGTDTSLARTSVNECGQHGSHPDMAGTVYAEVAYQSEGRWLRHRVVPVPQGIALKEGQTVYINVPSCALARRG